MRVVAQGFGIGVDFVAPNRLQMGDDPHAHPQARPPS